MLVLFTVSTASTARAGLPKSRSYQIESPLQEQDEVTVSQKPQTSSQRTKKAPIDNNNNNKADAYIVGGTVAAAGAYPFFVSSYGGKSLCGGTLIYPDIVLTAAHCQGAFNNGLVLGGVSAYDELDASDARIRTIDQQRPHTGFSQDPALIQDDIMLLRLTEPVSSNSTASVVKLNLNAGIPQAGEKVTAVGYGLTAYAGSPGQGNPNDNDTKQKQNATSSTQLLQISLNHVPTGQCAVALLGFDNVQIGDDILCAGYAGTQSICQGDSGGPLLINNNGGGDTQVGITSFTNECTASPTPNGFTRVSTFVDWIQGTICELSAVPPANCSIPNPPDVVETVPIEIIVRHDVDPHETTWSLRDTAKNQIVHAGPHYVPTANSTWATVLDVEPGAYKLELRDSFGDGMTRAEDQVGTVMVKALPTAFHQGGVLLPLTIGAFTDRLVLPFVVPEATAVFPTPFPTTSPSARPTTFTPFPSSTPSQRPTGEPTLTPQPTEEPTYFPTAEASQTLAPVRETDFPTISPTRLEENAAESDAVVVLPPTTSGSAATTWQSAAFCMWLVWYFW